MKGWAVACLLAVLLGVQYVRQKQKDADGAALLRGAEHTRDSVLARGAEKEIRWAADNDSLKTIIGSLRSLSPPKTNARGDTVYVPVAQYVYVTDTLIPACQLCALRTDSLIEQMQAERRANAHVETLMRREVLGLRKANERWTRLWPLIYIAGGTTVLLLDR